MEKKYKVVSTLNWDGEVVYTLHKKMFSIPKPPLFPGTELKMTIKDFWRPTLYYYKTKEEAQEKCDKLNEVL